MAEKTGSQRALARLVGVTDTAVIGWIGGAEPYESTLKKIAERTGISLAWLRDGVGDAETQLAMLSAPPRVQEAAPFTYGKSGGKIRRVPLVSWAQAGNPCDFATVVDWEDFVTTEIDDECAVAVRIRGDSMAPRYPEGVIAVISCSARAQNESLVIAKLRNEGQVFKRLQIVDPSKRLLRLISLNEQYEPLVRTEDQFEFIYPVRQIIEFFT